MNYCEWSTLNLAPDHVRELLFQSGVYGVNDVFLPLYTQKSFRKHLRGGRGSGKSHLITDYADYKLSQKGYCRVLFLRYVGEDVRDSLWRDFNDRIKERGREDYYQIVDTTMRARHRFTGNEIVCKGVVGQKSREAKMKSLAGFTHVIIDEANEIPKEQKMKLLDSIRKKGVEIEIIESWNTATKDHYIYDDYNLIPTEYEGYYQAEAKQESGILSIHSTYEDNRHNLNEAFLQRYDELKNGKDKHYYLTDVLGLIPSGLTGQIYSGWKRISLDFYHELDYNKYYYLDWGTNDPCAIGEVKIHNRQLFVKPLHYEPKLVKDIAKFLCDKGFSEQELIICDSSEPDNILKLRNGYQADEIGQWEIDLRPQIAKGFNTIGVAKGAGSVKAGIDLLKEYDVHIVEGELGDTAWKEYLEYRWEIDKDGKPTNQPIDKNNHHMDGIRYVPYMLPVIQ